MIHNGIIKALQEYQRIDNTTHPLFIAFDSADDLQELVLELETSFSKLYLSDFCSTDDAFPSIDNFFSALVKSKAQRLLILGCGEYAELNQDGHFLSRLFAIPCSTTQKIVIPLWNGYAFLEDKRQDPRVDDTRALAYTPTQQVWRLRRIPEKVKMDSLCGLKKILACLERGADGERVVKTACGLNLKWCKTINSAFDLYRSSHPSSLLSSNLFSEEDWERFLDDDRSKDEALESADSFLQLKLNPKSADSYLQAVLDRTESFADFHQNLVTSILWEDARDSNFPALYAEWKKIMNGRSGDDVQLYLNQSKRYDDTERLAYLSDNTIPERLEILSIIAKNKVFSEVLPKIYPQLGFYTSKYSFSIPDNQEMSGMFTDYFEAYKAQKLFNEISPSFMEKVEQIASERPYNMLPTRGAVLEKIKNEHTHLLWLDSLGCEFLGFIQRKSHELGLKIYIRVARAKLPTLTSVNRDFFEEWNKGTKEQSKELDKLKHGDFEDYGYERSKIPVELVYELKVLEQVLVNIAAHLKAGKSRKVVLASDHGATRLAVISGSETIWQLPGKGEHSGRCCPASEYDGELPVFVTKDEDNEWNIMANYNRFKGGRKADVEVHGGASLEEIVVPVIEFELFDSGVKVELLTKELKVSFRDHTITLILFCTQKIERFSVKFQGECFGSEQDTENPQKHQVVLPKPKCGSYSITVFEGDTQLDTLHFTVQNAGIGIKKDNFF